jgi:hypothetical protein
MEFIRNIGRRNCAKVWLFKEQLGGIQILEARDLNHAIQLVSQQPGFKYGLGPIEIRPVADLNEMMKESEHRRRRKDTSR